MGSVGSNSELAPRRRWLAERIPLRSPIAWALAAFGWLLLVAAVAVAQGATAAEAVYLILVPVALLAALCGRAAGVLGGLLAPITGYLIARALDLPTEGFPGRGVGAGPLVLAALGFGTGLAAEFLGRAARAESRLAVGRELLAGIATGRPLSETLEHLARRIEAELPAGRCSILSLDAERGTLHTVAAPSLASDYSEAIDGLRIGDGVGCCGTAAWRNEVVIAADTFTDPLWKDFRELARRHGLRACWSFPIRDTHGCVIGTFAIYYPRIRRPAAFEIALVAEAAHLAAIALERARSEARERELEEQVRTAQKLESLGLLAGGIAHDWNNLLVPILGHAELLGDSLDGRPEAAMAREIEKAARRAAELAQQMLLYAGRRQGRTERVDLADLVREIESLLRSAAPASVRLEIAADGPAFVRASSAQLQQVILNLVSNAVEALGENPGRIAVRVRSLHADRERLARALLGERLAPGPYACLEVADDGPGIPAELRNSIFDPFFSTRGAGRGLGLSIVFGVVRSHRGAVELDSGPAGTRFRVLLPAAPGGETRAESVPRPAGRAAPAGGTALVVDDEAAVRDVLRRYLGERGFDVLEASCGEEGLAAFRRRAEEIDLAIVDLTMPDLDGRTVLARLAAISDRARLVLTTGHDPENGGSAASSWPVLRKPFDRSDLDEALAAAARPAGRLS